MAQRIAQFDEQAECLECSTSFIKRADNHVYCSKSCGSTASKRKFNAEWHRNWKRQNADRYRKNQLVDAAKRRAKKANLPFDLTVNDFEIPKECPVLGIALYHNSDTGGFKDNSPSLDRIKPELGYVKGNVNVISWRANKIKGDATLAEFEKVLQYLKG